MVASDPLARLTSITPEMSRTMIQHASLMVKGPSGTGKTHLWGQMPGPIKVIYMDKNRATLWKIQRPRDDVEPYFISSFEEYADVFVPAAKNRQIDAATLVVDSGDRLQDDLIRETQGARSRMTQSDWGIILSKMSNTLSDLADATLEVPGKRRGYNVVFTWHVKQDKDEDGQVTDIRARARGQVTDIIEDFFDYVLISDKEVRRTPRSGGPPLVEPHYFLRTLAADRFQTTKAPAEWPERIESYSELAKLIGFEPSEPPPSAEALKAA